MPADERTIVEVDFDASCHSADAIQRAAYTFTDRFVLTLTSSAGTWHCALDFAGQHEDAVADVVREFRVAVLDYVLRERIRTETAPVRNAILAVAFSQIGADEESSGLAR